MKALPGQYLGLDEWVLTCIYTFLDEKQDDPQTAALKSFNFNLKLCHEPDPSQETPSEPVTLKDQLLPMVYFTPQNLDLEPVETLYQRMSDALKESNEDDDSVQEIEML
ncbi:hypothetical protein C0992_001811 [Termitomyces sp. T32_za158]|nr:hypothetical protein C0992_001811 [Termitomyces sp. T32_za158]